MTDQTKIADQLDDLRDAFKEWSAFPCNKLGNKKSADKERATMLKAINALEKKVGK